MGENDVYKELLIRSFSTAFPEYSDFEKLQTLLTDDYKRFKELIKMPINDNFKIAALLMLIQKKKDTNLVLSTLNSMKPQGALRFFQLCIMVNKTGKTIRKLFREYMKDKDERFVILNKRRIAYLSRKFHLKREPRNEDMLTFLFEKKAKKGTIYYDYLMAKKSMKSLKKLPFSIGIGFLNQLSLKKRKEYLKSIARKITPNEAVKYFKLFKREGIDVTKKLESADPLKVYKLYKLGQVSIDTYMKSVANFARKLNIPKEMKNAVLVYDNSESTRFTVGSRFNDILLVLADTLSHTIPVYLGNGKAFDRTHRKTEYKTILVPGLWKAAKKSDIVIIATDGYENFPAFLTDIIFNKYNNSGKKKFIQIMPENGRRITGIPAFGIRNTNQIEPILKIAKEVIRD